MGSSEADSDFRKCRNARRINCVGVVQSVTLTGLVLSAKVLSVQIECRVKSVKSGIIKLLLLFSSTCVLFRHRLM